MNNERSLISGLFRRNKYLPSKKEIEEQVDEIDRLITEHGHDLSFYEELHGSLTTLKWVIGLPTSIPPLDYYFDSLEEEERFIEKE